MNKISISLNHLSSPLMRLYRSFARENASFFIFLKGKTRKAKKFKHAFKLLFVRLGKKLNENVNE